MSNSRIAAIAFVAGFGLATLLNAAIGDGPMLNLVRQIASGMIGAAVCVAAFGDRK